VSSGAPHQLFSCSAGADWSLVRSQGRHHLERIGNRDDPRRQADLRIRETVRIPLPVEALVVLSDGVYPISEPRSKRGDDPSTDLRVEQKRSPLGTGRLTRLVEDPRVNVELSDVVEKSRPPQPVPVG
jgi:hypothetical protein